MSHKPTPYSPNFPQSQGYAPPPEEKPKDYPTAHGGYIAPAHPGVNLPPGAQPLPGMQSGFQPGFQPGFAGGYPHPQPVYPQPQSGYPPPVMQQPIPQPPMPMVPIAAGGWMTIPQGLHDCPPGLEYLAMIDQVLIHQKVEVLEAFTGFETNNKYTIKNALGQKVYYAVEDNNCCTRNCCGPTRPFDIKILDNFRNEVIHLNRPLACDSCFCPCWLQTLEVTAPPGTVIGSIEQQWSICKPCYAIKNAVGDTVLRIKGPICKMSICGDVEFRIFSKDGENEIGMITKEWSGLAREAFTDTDYFGVKFPIDLDVKIKAVLLGACFLIDFMFFETAKRHGGRDISVM